MAGWRLPSPHSALSLLFLLARVTDGSDHITSHHSVDCPRPHRHGQGWICNVVAQFRNPPQMVIRPLLDCGAGRSLDRGRHWAFSWAHTSKLTSSMTPPLMSITLTRSKNRSGSIHTNPGTRYGQSTLVRLTNHVAPSSRDTLHLPTLILTMPVGLSLRSRPAGSCT